MRINTVKSFGLILACVFFILIAGCSGTGIAPTPTEDTSYLTPIPEATLIAFRRGASIDNKLQAVIVARIELMSPIHFKPVGTQEVLFVEELNLSEAYRMVENAGSSPHQTSAGTTKVWLVIFEGDIEVTPPLQRTPNPPFHSCSYVIFDAVGGQGGEVGGVDCGKFINLSTK